MSWRIPSSPPIEIETTDDGCIAIRQVGAGGRVSRVLLPSEWTGTFVQSVWQTHHVLLELGQAAPGDGLAIDVGDYAPLEMQALTTPDRPAKKKGGTL